MFQGLSRFFTVLLAAMLLLTSYGAAAKNTLITMPGAKPNLAQSMKEVGNDKLEFTLDPHRKFTEDGKEEVLKTAFVRNSLKRATHYFGSGKTLTEVKDSGNTVVVTYSGDKNKALAAIAEIEVRKKPPTSGGFIVASTVSDGGIRAKAAVRDPEADEVMALVIKPQFVAAAAQDKPLMQVQVTKVGSSVHAVKVYDTIAVDTQGFKVDRSGQTIYFTLGKKVGDYWEGAQFTAQ